MLCLQGRRTLVALVLGRREEAHRLHYFLRRRSVRRLHLRLKVISLCVENYCARRATPVECNRRTSYCPLPRDMLTQSDVVVCSGAVGGPRLFLFFHKRAGAHRLPCFRRRWWTSGPGVDDSVSRMDIGQNSDTSD